MAGARLLVVDDNSANLRLVSFILLAQGYEVRQASDAEGALQILQTFAPDLILMDLQLPRMDGFELTRRIKAEPATRHVPVIALTAFALSGDREKALARGCDAYLSKPFAAEELRKLVARFIGQPGRPRAAS